MKWGELLGEKPAEKTKTAKKIIIHRKFTSDEAKGLLLWQKKMVFTFHEQNISLRKTIDNLFGDQAQDWNIGLHHHGDHRDSEESDEDPDAQSQGNKQDGYEKNNTNRHVLGPSADPVASTRRSSLPPRRPQSLPTA